MEGHLNGPRTIAIAGKVGAGAQVPVFDAYAKGAGPQVECPPGLSPHGVVAVEVEGDSMEPVYSAGDLLFYTRDSHEGVPSEVLGKRCVCEDETGMGWVKVLREGREEGTFDLHSFNDTSPTKYGVRLKWASPVRLHWPAELARKTL
ncbi:putative phage repressor [Salipiger abyssi]|uniref:Putative phage repressor n=2 Tax=Salipiger abyssi TaxID=1250539 RepID=A0A1P8UWF0_9RHOB|nr:putative phage repressor [Salipiger abyssi]